MQTTINLTGEEATPSTLIISRSDVAQGRRFFCLNLGWGVTIIMPGSDQEAANYAMQLAAVLHDVAYKLTTEVPA